MSLSALRAMCLCKECKADWMSRTASVIEDPGVRGRAMNNSFAEVSCVCVCVWWGCMNQLPVCSNAGRNVCSASVEEEKGDYEEKNVSKEKEG